MADGELITGGEDQQIFMNDGLYEEARQRYTDGAPSSIDGHFDRQALLCLTPVERNNVLHVAAQHGSQGFIVKVVAQFPGYVGLLCQQNHKGETPLHLAAQFGDRNTVQALLEAHDRNTSSALACWSVEDVNGNTPLHRALRYRNEDIALMVLQRDAGLVSRRNNVGETPAYLAAENFCERFLRSIFDLVPYNNGGHVISLLGPFDQTVFHPARKLADDIMSKVIEMRGLHLLDARDNRNGKTVLHYAVEEKRESIVKLLLRAKSTLAYVTDFDDLTPLHRAATMGSSSMVQIILELSPQSILHHTNHGQTALHVAKMDASFLAKCLRNTRMKELINVADNDGNTPLHLAVRGSCNLDIANALLDVVGINWRLKNNAGCTPMDLCTPDDPIRSNLRHLESAWRVKEVVNMEIFFRNNVRMNVGELLNRYSWDECLTYQGYQGNSILHIAARDGCLDIINKACESPRATLLLVSGENSEGETPLHLAAEHGWLSVVDVIVLLSISTDAQGNPIAMVNGRPEYHNAVFKPWKNKSANGDTPLHRAVRHRHPKVAFYLLSRVPELASYVNEESESVLYLAVQNSCKSVIREVLKLTQYSVSGPDGQNPLHAAVRNAEISVERCINLFNRLRNLSAVDKEGKTPLHYAVEQNRHPVVIELLKLDISAAFIYDNEGFTPLLRAVASGFQLCVKFILERCPHSAELRVAHNSQTVLHLAKSPDYALWKCLEEHGLLKQLINEPDRNGNTPLHCAILDDDITKAINITRIQGVNRRIKNNQQQTPLDLCKQLMRNGDGEQQMIRLCFEHLQNPEAKAAGSKISKIISACTHPIELGLCQIKVNFPNFRVVIGDTAAYLEGLTEKELKQLLNNIAVAAALLVTVTFAAIFTVPGGYNSTTGELIRMSQVAVKLFVGSDIVAMLMGIAVLLKYTFGVTRRMFSLRRLAGKCIHMLLCSVLATTAAFTFAVYAVVVHRAAELLFLALAVVGAVLFWCIL